VMRIPRMIGLPLQISGLIVILLIELSITLYFMGFR
jgi:hypothetical protein